LLGWEVDGWTGAPYAFVDATWAPREMWIVKAEPIDPYYAYGTMEMYIDKLARLAVFDVKYNRAGEYWKTMMNLYPMNVIPDPKYAPTGHAFNLNGPMVVVDDRTHHAMGQPIDEIRQFSDSPPRSSAKPYSPCLKNPDKVICHDQTSLPPLGLIVITDNYFNVVAGA